MRLITKFGIGLVFIFCLVLTLNLFSSHASASSPTKGQEGFEGAAAPLWYTYTQVNATIDTSYAHNGINSLSGNWPVSSFLMFPNSYYNHTSEWSFYMYMQAPIFSLYERYITGDDAEDRMQPTYWNAQTFTVGTTGAYGFHSITGVRLKVHSSGAGTFTVGIRATDVNGKPTGKDLTNITVNKSVLPGASAWHWFNFTAPYTLNKGTKYAIVSRTTTNYVYWRADSTVATYPGGSYGYSSNSGSTWTMNAVDDFMFEEYGYDIVSSLEVSENGSGTETMHVFFNTNHTVFYYDGSTLTNLSYNFNYDEWYYVDFWGIDWYADAYDLLIADAGWGNVKNAAVNFEHSSNYYSYMPCFREILFSNLKGIRIDDIWTDAYPYVVSLSPSDGATTGPTTITAILDDYDDNSTGGFITMQWSDGGAFTIHPVVYTGDFPISCSWDMASNISYGNLYVWRIYDSLTPGYLPYHSFGYGFLYSDASPPTSTLVYPVSFSTTSPTGWKIKHDIQISAYDDGYYDFVVLITFPGSAASIYPGYLCYMVADGHDPTSPYYNSSLHHKTGWLNLTFPGEQWVPFLGFQYNITILFYQQGYIPCKVGSAWFYISPSPLALPPGNAIISLRGFVPENGNMQAYNRVGQSIWYWMMNNRQDGGTITASIYLTDETGKVIAKYPNGEHTSWLSVPYLQSGKYYSFEPFTQWASQLKINRNYCFYIGFSQTFWGSSNLEIQLPYDKGEILNFSGNWPYLGWPDHIYDDDHEHFKYWGAKITFSTYTSTSAMTGSGASEGEATGGTWGSNLGAQIDTATGISGIGIVIGLVVLALFSFLPIIILKHVPTLEIMILFADFGAVFNFALGLFPLWIFFLVVILVVLFLIYRVRSWIMQGTQMQDVVDNQGTIGGGISKTTRGVGKRIVKGVKKLTK